MNIFKYFFMYPLLLLSSYAWSMQTALDRFDEKIAAIERDYNSYSRDLHSAIVSSEALMQQNDNRALQSLLSGQFAVIVSREDFLEKTIDTIKIALGSLQQKTLSTSQEIAQKDIDDTITNFCTRVTIRAEQVKSLKEQRIVAQKTIAIFTLTATTIAILPDNSIIGIDDPIVIRQPRNRVNQPARGVISAIFVSVGKLFTCL